jgi:hypothetical protein
MYTPESNKKNIPNLAPAAQSKGQGRSNTSADDAKNPVIQAKLTVGQPNDRFEQEADRVANRVMSLPQAAAEKRQGIASVEAAAQPRPLSAQISPLAQRRPIEEDEEAVQPKSRIQAQPLEEEEEIQTKSLLQMQPLEEEEEKLQAKANGDQPAAASAAVETGINQKKGSGQLLPPDTRSAMESRFGADFSRVNVHTDPASIQMNRELNSQAFTVGNNIFFNSGKFQPDSSSGQHLLAHELTHVLQQTGPNKKIQRQTACAADPQFRRTHPYWSWIDNKILAWQQIAINKIRFWLQSVLIASTRSRTAQLSARLTRTERTLATAESNSANVGLAFTGNLLWVIAGIGPQKPIFKAIQVGGALIASLSSLSFDESRPVNTPAFLDQLGGLANLVGQIGLAVPNSLAQAVREKRRLASESLCRLAADRSADPNTVYQTLFHETFPELPNMVAQSQGPTGASGGSRPTIRIAPPESATPGTQSTRGAVPSLGVPEPVASDFLTAVEADIMQRLQSYMRRISSEARSVMRGRQRALQRISSGQSSESELRQVMELVGISETASSMASSITGGAGEVQASRLFDRIQSSLDYDSYKVRIAAILALTRVTRDGRVPRELALPELIRKLSDDEDIVRVIAAHGLAQLNAVIAIPAIYRTLRSLDDDGKKRLVRRALEQLTSHASRQ